MRVLLVTSEGACGVAEHSAYLMEHVRATDPSIQIDSTRGLLDPRVIQTPDYDVVHLNYHAALHSQWTPVEVQRVQTTPRMTTTRGSKVLITYHDSGVPNSQQCLDLYAVADAFVVHEPCTDLPKAIYWRQGIPAPYGQRVSSYRPRPVVGSVGFPFGWKNYDLLVEGAAQAGWDVLLLAPTATDDDIARWSLHLSLGDRLKVVQTFQPAAMVVQALSACDATAFLYNCHNTGTSGAIRQGIAARKPVIASKFPAGRQFRDLQEDDLGLRVITWIEPNLDQVVEALSRVKIAPVDAGMVRLAHRDSWAGLGQRYARLYKELVGR